MGGDRGGTDGGSFPGFSLPCPYLFIDLLCIGQRADGTILLLVLEGRKPDSLGASYDDIAGLMFDNGAVNAANLDGGSSSQMYYNGEQITRGSNLIGMRQMADAILVLN